MGVGHEAVRAVGRAFGTARAGTETLLSRNLAGPTTARIEVTSPAFTQGSALPVESTAEGGAIPIPPALAWGEIPPGTRSIAVVVEDPDAPLPEPFVHWLVYGIPATARALDALAAQSYREGKNSKLATGFTPAAPPPGHGPHRYHFQVFALDVAIDDAAGLGRGALVRKMQGHVLAAGEIVGVYERA